jgi:hypothetical protein
MFQAIKRGAYTLARVRKYGGKCPVHHEATVTCDTLDPDHSPRTTIDIRTFTAPNMPHWALWVNADATQEIKIVEGDYLPPQGDLLLKTICVGVNPGDWK